MWIMVVLNGCWYWLFVKYVFARIHYDKRPQLPQPLFSISVLSYSDSFVFCLSATLLQQWYGFVSRKSSAKRQVYAAYKEQSFCLRS